MSCVHCVYREFCKCGRAQEDRCHTDYSQGQEEWTVETHTKTFETDAFGEVQFENASITVQAKKV